LKIVEAEDCEVDKIPLQDEMVISTMKHDDFGVKK